MLAANTRLLARVLGLLALSSCVSPVDEMCEALRTTMEDNPDFWASYAAESTGDPIQSVELVGCMDGLTRVDEGTGQMTAETRATYEDDTPPGPVYMRCAFNLFDQGWRLELCGFPDQ